MNRIPFDVIINHIIPYTYNVQPRPLLEDIKNYYTVKEILMDKKHDIDMIKQDILAVFYFNTDKLSSILHRHFLMGNKSKDYNMIYNFSQNTRFNILFGLFTKEERNQYLEYMLEYNGIWILRHF